MFFSPSTNGFYPEDRENIPSDAVEISALEHQQLLHEQSQGKEIKPGAGGVPVAVDLPPPTSDQLVKRARAQRDRLLVESDYTQLLDSPVDPAPWAVYRQELRDIPQQQGFPDNIQWPEKPE